jgi:hypothetical protein
VVPLSAPFRFDLKAALLTHAPRIPGYEPADQGFVD